MYKPLLLPAVILGAALGASYQLPRAEAGPCSINTVDVDGYCLCVTPGSSYESCEHRAGTCKTSGFCQC